MSGHAGLGSLRTFIFERRDDFPEILSFVRDMDARYGLHLEELEGDFRSGLASLIRHSGIKAIVLGTRRRGRPACSAFLLCSKKAPSLLLDTQQAITRRSMPCSPPDPSLGRPARQVSFFGILGFSWRF